MFSPDLDRNQTSINSVKLIVWKVIGNQLLSYHPRSRYQNALKNIIRI